MSPKDDEDKLVPVSPRHSVLVGPEYAVWIKRAPRQDFVVRTIMKREANGMPLVSADIVIAGEETRANYPLAEQYPLHFRKTYYPGRLHGDPRQERDRQNEAAEILGIPEGVHQGALIPTAYYTGDTFRPAPRDPLDAVLHVDGW